VTTPPFDRLAHVTTGTEPTTPGATYRVTVGDGRLRLTPPTAAVGDTVLDVPLVRVEARTDRGSGAMVVQVDAAPIHVDFTLRDPESGSGVAAQAQRALSGRTARRRFAAALRGE
jgi:hypothetical protein